ncbi:MFS transporter [Rhodococcus sp. 06-156-3C]|nr:MFS transporter [Rhodococcus sp. 06-156-4C]OZD19720.1 MFS transporter [Rhodococcus sp. 06-156-4a]OZD22969.1 MFS transporter [Rhodococcus sp. 06-156-3C]OZD25739.1 MFS transporter [Rhodococcus sp. 06-156-3b]OZD37946.1 MFS transporter [Rhodococcus sp. 06-156-3]OZF68565.1 MFS transporter [Rhodococcus sp. 06-156-4]
MGTATAARVGSLRSSYAVLPTASKLLMINNFGISLGFYMVLPFLATYLRGDLGFSVAFVGIVLGLRTFSQQGLFLVGGTLADRWGPRATIITGCALRIVAFGLYATTDSAVGVVTATVAIGVAGAIFSPAVRTYLMRESDTDRAEVFSVYNVFGNAGALVGPLLGAALLSVDFRLIAAIAAAVFAVLTAAQLIALPRQPRIEHHDSVVGSWGLVLRNRRFLIFTLGGCAYFALFNQLYLALPIEAERVTGNPQSVSVVFVVSTVLGIGLQMPVTAVARRLLRPGSAAGLGVGLMGAAFVPLAVSAPILDTAAESRPIAGWLTLLWPVILTTAVFSIGIALANPYIMELLGVVGEDRLSGTYYGWFYLVSAVASLVVGSVVGRALDITEPSWRALPFVVLAAVGAVGSAIVAEMTRRNLLQEQSVTARS